MGFPALAEQDAGRATAITRSRPVRDERALGLLALTIAAIVFLACAQIWLLPAPMVAVGQVGLVVAFALLTALDIRLAVTLVIVELAVAGASGRWTVFPGGVSGRILIDGIVFTGAGLMLLNEVRRSRRLDLGRYGLHALAVATVMGAIWIPLGLANGHDPALVLGDANGYLFLAFIIVMVALIKRGEAGWIRRSLFIGCVVNAVFLGAVILLAWLEVAPLYPTARNVLIERLGFGGAVGFMPSGAWRLYTASGLYLQVGLALVVWRLLQGGSAWLWGLYALLWVDIAVTYTRGFWIASVLVLGTVLVLGAREWVRPAKIVAGTLAIAIAATALGWMFAFSVPDYLLQRASSILATRPVPSATFGASLAPTPRPVATPAAPSPTPAGDSADVLGQVGNQIRLEQARILLDHIRASPVLGEGFGAIAPEYRHDDVSRYEISYLDLAFKTGLLGSFIFLSFPLRLLMDAIRARAGRHPLAPGVSRHEAAVPVAILGGLLLVSATNPYLFGAFGLALLLVCVAWLDGRGRGPSVDPRSAGPRC